MFTGVCLSTGGVPGSGEVPGPGGCLVPGGFGPGELVGRGGLVETTAAGGRYAYYWNAFLWEVSLSVRFLRQWVPTYNAFGYNDISLH